EGEIAVKGGLPGQTVRVRLNKKRKSKWEGRLLEVVKPSDLETRQPVCKEFGLCGGCTYQTFSYEEQLKLKAAQVKELLDNVVKGDYVFEEILGSPREWNYRNKMEFSFGDDRKDGPLTLGLHKKNSMYDVVTTGDCQIADPDFTLVLNCVLEHFTALGTDFYKKMSHEGYLRHLLIRRAVKTGEMLVSIITSSQEVIDMKPLVDKLLTLPLTGVLKGILHITNDSLADVVQSDKTEILYGEDFFYEELLGLKFKISTFSFFQTNSLGAEVLYSKAREYIGDTKDKLIFDLYSGTGTIAQLMAPVAKKVIGVEIVEEAVLAARENAALNGLSNCEFIAGDVLKVLDEIEDKPDLIVLDPPRDGIHPKALKKLLDYGVENMVYISCKPTSLARDLEPFQEAGYHVVKVCCVDMFPQTTGIETVCLLINQNAKFGISVDNKEAGYDH
ncbi:MAG: 23S rRNA (uracil(1939)-C(5))-methyltransferase RlmD, partial [Acetatifactor sp.]|nr:23S rRNA (uracil(1939)-C(5))-methyltransferase RlmD [Acetatifactor sp.]